LKTRQKPKTMKRLLGVLKRLSDKLKRPLWHFETLTWQVETEGLSFVLIRSQSVKN
jgi:hypothetical protein